MVTVKQARALVIGSGLLNLAAFYAPWFSTPTFGAWTIKNYDQIVREGGYIVYVAPTLALLLTLLFGIFANLFRGRSKTFNRINGALCALIGGAGIVFLVVVNHLMMTLFFSSALKYHTGIGVYLVALSHVLIAIGGILMFRNPQESSDAKVKVETEQTDISSTSTSSDSTLRQRKKQQSENTPTTRSPSSSSSKSTSSPYETVLYVILLLIVVYICFQNINHYRSTCVLSMDQVKLPPGFKMEIFADGVTEARSMAMGPSGILFVGSRLKGNVYAVLDDDKDFKADRVITIQKGLTMPNGVAFKGKDLYLAEISKLWKFENVEENLRNAIKNNVIDFTEVLPKTLVTDTFPNFRHHGWKYIAFGPDNRLYVPYGAPCNLCFKNESIFATIMRQKSVDSWEFEIFAEGIRNTVGFDWHPVTKELWFTENGRDLLTHELPPDEINHAPTQGLHFGYPHCFGENQKDPELEIDDCSKFTPSKFDIPAHAAALALKFYTGEMFPPEYRNQILVAEHGSWNRIPTSGYRVMLAKLNGNEVTSYEDFITGFIQNEKPCGRPVDILILHDGSLLLSDDFADRIYRITYSSS